MNFIFSQSQTELYLAGVASPKYDHNDVFLDTRCHSDPCVRRHTRDHRMQIVGVSRLLPTHSLNADNTARSCRRQFSKYTCPTCNAPYCSLPCFRSEVWHLLFHFWCKATLKQRRRLILNARKRFTRKRSRPGSMQNLRRRLKNGRRCWSC